MNIKIFCRSLFSIFVMAPLLLALLVTGGTAVAATDDEIEGSIIAGIDWLAGAQIAGGSWSNHTAITCMALIKLQDRAYELEDPDTGEPLYTSPFDPDYPYSANIIAGWEYVFGGSQMLKQTPLPTQPYGEPDTNGNDYGVYFTFDDHHDVYTTSLCLVALTSSGTPDRLNDGGVDFNGDGNADTFGELAQEATDWMAYAQQDTDPRRGGWSYMPVDNGIQIYPDWRAWADNSHSGYAVLGLAAAQSFGLIVPDFVKSELDLWIDYIQDGNGASGYEYSWNWQNVLKTGNLLFQMTFVGDVNTSLRFEDALAYIESEWRNPSHEPGWNYSGDPANYQAMFTLMKGLEFSNVELIDTDGDGVRDNDWFNQEPTLAPSQDFASVLVAQQNADGSWPECYWGNAELCTTWALLTLEMVVPDPFNVEVDKDYRYTSVCFEMDNDLDGLFSEDPVEYGPDGIALRIDNDRDGLIDEDGIDCDPSDTGYELPITGIDPEAYTVEAVVKKNGKVSSYNPGQYYAVSTVNVARFNQSIASVLLTIEEDFGDCTIGDFPLSVLSPKTGGGSVVVVEVIDGVAYQIYDASSDAVTINFACGVECSATAEFEYNFEPGQEEAMLLVYVKFGPGLKGLILPEDPEDLMCLNINSATLKVFGEGEEDPVFMDFGEADAFLEVVEK